MANPETSLPVKVGMGGFQDFTPTLNPPYFSLGQKTAAIIDSTAQYGR